MNTSTITCVCERSFEADIPESVELSEDPAAYEGILNGTYLTLTCPHCGHIIKPDIPLRITDVRKGIDIFVRLRLVVDLPGTAALAPITIVLVWTTSERRIPTRSICRMVREKF